MSKLTMLSDAELDAVTGGILNAGDGGVGGGIVIGANVNGSLKGGSNDLSVNCSGRNTANGGRGGSVNISLSLGGRSR